MTSDLNDWGVQRVGQLNLDNVEIYNCSRYDDITAAVRFEDSNFGYSSITNSAISSGQGNGILI